MSWMPSSTVCSCVTSCRFVPVTTSDNGTPCPSANKCRWLPFLPPLRRIRTGLLLRQGRLHHRPIDALPAPGDAFHLFALCRPRTPWRLEKPRFLPLQKALMHCTGAAKPFLRQAPSIGNPCAAQTRWPRKPLAPAWVCARRRACERRFSADRAHVWVAPVAPRGSRTHPSLPTTWLPCIWTRQEQKPHDRIAG